MIDRCQSNTSSRVARAENVDYVNAMQISVISLECKEPHHQDT